MRVGSNQDSVVIGPLKLPARRSVAPKAPEADTSLPKDQRVVTADSQSKESLAAGTAAADAAGKRSTPQIGAIALPDHPVQVSCLSPLLQPEALHTQGYLSLFKGPEQAAWNQVVTYAGDYHPDKIDVPFPYPADAGGRMEANDTDTIVRGLWAKGGYAQARGVLENWLHLGERYTALPGTNQLNDLGRSGMPKLSSLLLEEAGRHQDPDFLQRAYNVIADDHKHNWSDTYFKQCKNGLNRFCDVDYSHDATLAESGGEKNEARFDGDPMPFNPIDLNAHLYRTEKDLQTMATMMAKETGEPAWKAKAALWGQKAATRKALILDKMWSAERGLFTDIKVADGEKSSVDTLAALSVLEAGLLDPNNPKESAMARQLADSVDKFKLPDGGYAWDNKGKKPAEPQDLLAFSRGLKSYGFEAQAKQLERAAQGELGSSEGTPGQTATQLASLAILHPTEFVGPHKDSPEDWMSPKGLGRLRNLVTARGLSSMPQVPVKEACRIDRTLSLKHPSMLSLPVLKELQQQDLTEAMLGVSLKEGEVKLAPGPALDFKPAPTTMQLGASKLKFDLPDLQAAPLGHDAYKLRRNGKNLKICRTPDHLILGDRAYDIKQFGDKEIKLPQDIIGAFHTAGDNPQLESFFEANREWIKINSGPASEFAAMPNRPGWNKLYDATGKNWRELTIEPSVTNHDTAMQYFNPAAVPSVGIFKTQFNWDTMFMAKGMQLQGQEETVAGMADNLLYLLKSTKRVPNAARSVYMNKSQPPFLPSLVRMSEPIRKRTIGAEATDRWVREAYDVMKGDFHDFWREEGGRNVGRIDGHEVHLSRWGGPNHKFAMDESGFDTTSRFYGKTMDLVPPDLNAFLWGYAHDMEAIAFRLRDKAQAEGNNEDFLKYSAEGAKWSSEAEQIKKDVISYCWDDKDGMFRDYRFQGEGKGLQKDQDALSACMAPLWVGMLDPNVPEEKRMIERSLDNVSRFEKDHGLAATAEDYGHPEMQWNGPSGWAPLHMMTIESEVRYGRYDAAARQTQKWLDTMDRMYDKDGMIIERYDVVKGGHPPVQKGRYEETQGAGPGFGWTNATVPWALIEVVGGVRLHRDAEAPTRMDIIPHLPEGLQTAPTKLKFVNPGSNHEWTLSHHYQKDKSRYDFSIDGDFSSIPDLKLVTPPLPRGMAPKKSDHCPGYRIKEQPAENGLVRYELDFHGLAGKQKFDLSWGAQA